jgi:hypothetical protein
VSRLLSGALERPIIKFPAFSGLFPPHYYWMQPTRLPNPGMAALKPSSRTLSYVELLRSEREAAKRDVRVEPEPESVGAAAPQAPSEVAGLSARGANTGLSASAARCRRTSELVNPHSIKPSSNA